MTKIAPDTRANAKRLRTDATPQERKLWTKLREVNHMIGTHFRRQAPIGPYIADFVDFGRRLVIEADGGGHGGVDDDRRDAWLCAEGFTVLRFWNNDIDGNIDGLMRMVLDALAVAPPPPSPPHAGEGGLLDGTVRTRPNRKSASPPPRGEGMGEGGREARPQDTGHTP